MGGGSIDGDALQKNSVTCNGVTKENRPCSISWDLDAQGFCKYHTPQASQCRGIARSSGLRCRIKWDLNALGYCRHHASSAPRTSRQCVAIARTTGQRCRITTGIDAHGRCSVHQKTTLPSPSPPTETTSPSPSPLPPSRCQGVTMHSSEPCLNVPKPGYAYCCASHDPSLAYFSPRLFDSGDKQRATLEPLVVQVYDGRDLYHGDLLDLTTPGLVELDHILEKQCFSYAFQGLTFDDHARDVAFLASIVRDDLANSLSNVCLTRAATNKIKGAAVWKFLDDSLTGHVGSTTQSSSPSFTGYMMAETRDGVRLGRNTTRVVVREMGRALKQCQQKMAQQGETPLLDALSGQLQDLFVKMDLHVAASVQAKWDAAAKAHDSHCGESEDSANEDSVVLRTSGRRLPASAIDAKPFVPACALSASEAEDAATTENKVVVVVKDPSQQGGNSDEAQEPVEKPSAALPLRRSKASDVGVD